MASVSIKLIRTSIDVKEVSKMYKAFNKISDYIFTNHRS